MSQMRLTPTALGLIAAAATAQVPPDPRAAIWIRAHVSTGVSAVTNETTLPAHFRHVPHAALTVAVGDRPLLVRAGRVPSIASLKPVVADHRRRTTRQPFDRRPVPKPVPRPAMVYF